MKKGMKMIIADDEPVIAVGIQKLVDWNALGIEIVGQYTDGKAALSGIMEYKPDIVLLDISMPGMTGVEILKECHLLELPSRIIFISGFQDFEYAKAALQYGAVDYLLKPIIRDELLQAVSKSMNQLEQDSFYDSANDKEEIIDDYRGLLPLEEGGYLPVYAEIFQQQEENAQMKKLVRFSVLSFMEEYLEKRNLGIVFTKNDDIVVVFKGIGQREGKENAIELCEEVSRQLGCSMGMIIGTAVEHMSEIPAAFQRCCYLKDYFFFADQMFVPILLEGEKVFAVQEENGRFQKIRSQMIDTIIAQDAAGFQKSFAQFVKALCRRADGKKEDAFFYFCSAVRRLDEKFQNLALPRPSYDEKELLQTARSCQSYLALQNAFRGILQEYFDKLKSNMGSSSNKDFLKAKIYIDKHYDENLTLEILAKEVHMNPYYFSSFFKKNAGENFKDYVSRVRVQHAVSLLVSTDLKAYEIAMQVGFSDARVFSENFQRIYHETPNAYRKRAKQTQDHDQ